ncbi:TadE family protein [Nocardioides okcheonensis]|uniref:TadE family protein n=1 Tax=Nocardioides okcheonensis TaxID=2894081 RepID=UPI001E54B80E|nr:TadE family protein [Nocardioides okcheonensis]UFN43725.1 pilus assembly protein [Nocardioides okcheonensis]
MRFFARRRDDRGAVAVEFALTVPILLLFFLGTIELGLYMKDNISMSSSVRAGARSASAAADAGPGTCEASASPPPCSPASVPGFAQAAADTMQTAGMAMNSADIQWVMVYKANGAGFPGTGSTIPASCSGVANCVMYVWDAGVVTANGTGRFRYSSGSWASATVNACLNETDAVGVALRANHNWMTGLMNSVLGGAKVMTERTVMKFEPLEQDRCKPGTPNAHN